MSKTIQFNTGRRYTAEGQIVVATLHADGVVTFYDHSREIDGEFRPGEYCPFDQTEVMHWYDSGMAHSTARSYADAMLNGCNARK